MPKILGQTGGGFRVTKALTGIAGIVPSHLYRAAVSAEEDTPPVQYIVWASGLTQPPLVTVEFKIHEHPYMKILRTGSTH